MKGKIANISETKSWLFKKIKKIHEPLSDSSKKGDDQNQ